MYRFIHLPASVEPPVLEVDRRAANEFISADVIVVHDFDLLNTYMNKAIQQTRHMFTAHGQNSTWEIYRELIISGSIFGRRQKRGAFYTEISVGRNLPCIIIDKGL